MVAERRRKKTAHKSTKTVWLGKYDYPIVIVDGRVLVKYKSMDGAGIAVQYERQEAVRGMDGKPIADNEGNIQYQDVIGSKRLRVTRTRIGERLNANQYSFIVKGKDPKRGIEVEIRSGSKRMGIVHHEYHPDSKALLRKVIACDQHA